MRVLLVVPRTVGVSYGYTNFPIGIAYISSSLKQAGHDVTILNLNDYYAPIFNPAIIEMMIRRRIAVFNPRIVATGGLSAQYDSIHAIIGSSKRIQHDIVTIIGGGCVSSEPELIMNNINADFGVIGEGEETIVELLERMESGRTDFETVHGIVFKKNGQLVTTSSRKPIENLDTVPLPDYEGINIRTFLDRQTLTDQDIHPYNQPRVFELAASRSCPFKCTFCFHPVGDRYRKRSIDSVISEIDLLVQKYNVNYILLNDELFASDKKWLIAFCERIKKYEVKWQAQIRVDIVDEELILLLKDAGCIYISYGLESASPTILKSMRKKITLEQIENALALTKKHDILIQGNFIFGDRAETVETMVETLNWWFKHREYRINLSQLIPYPGTALYHYAIEQNLFKHDRIEYMKNGCKGLNQINLTKLPDDVYWNMLNVIIGNLRPGNFKPGKIESCKLEGCDPYQGYFYSVRIQCPYCNESIDYFPIHSKYVKHNLKTYRDFGFGCRHCNQRMTFGPPETEILLMNLVKENDQRQFAIIGADEKTKIFVKTSYFIQQYCSVIILDQDSSIKEIAGIPIRSSSVLNDLSTRIDGAIRISAQEGHLDDLLKVRGVNIYNISGDLNYLEKCENKEQIQAHFNRVSEKINQAKRRNGFDEVNFLLLELLDSYPSALDLHRNLIESTLNRNDFLLFFDICYTMASMMPPNDFAAIKQTLLNVFPQLVNNNLRSEAMEIIKVLQFNNPAEDTGLIQSLTASAAGQPQGGMLNS